MSDLEERVDNDNASDGGDDLFGDDDGDDASQIADNEPLPSDDDDVPVKQSTQRSATRDSVSDRDNRSQRETSVEVIQRKVVQEVLPRHGLPRSKDGSMRIVKVPNFLRFLPEEYDEEEHEPSAWAMENARRRIPINLIRYRKNPKTGELESNANIFRWSDGSLTLQVGEEHYDVQAKAQIPPPNKPYVPDRDAHRYLAAAQSISDQLLTVGHITEEWAIRPDKQRIEEDTELLRERMGLAKGGLREGEMIITTTQDPELQKKQAELAEKERIRAQRRRENAQMRMEGGGNGGYRKGGLSINDLEGGRRTTSGRKRGPGGSSKRSQRRNNDEYDSDDDLPAGARGRDNEYDKMDDFIASSGEEAMESGDDDDDILDDGDIEVEDERPRAKRPRTTNPSEDEVDADGEPEDSAPAAGDHGRRRVRRVVSDDDD